MSKSTLFVQNDNVNQSKSSISSMTACICTSLQWQQEHWRKCMGGSTVLT